MLLCGLMKYLLVWFCKEARFTLSSLPFPGNFANLFAVSKEDYRLQSDYVNYSLKKMSY